MLHLVFSYLNFTDSPLVKTAYYPHSGVNDWSDPIIPVLHNGTLSIAMNNPPPTPNQPEDQLVAYITLITHITVDP